MVGNLIVINPQLAELFKDLKRKNLSNRSPLKDMKLFNLIGELFLIIISQYLILEHILDKLIFEDILKR